jgi:hypothetical protein
MTRPEGYRFCPGKRSLHPGESQFQVRTSFDGLTLTIVVTVVICGEPGSPVDRDHAHLLREFMEAPR